jgi:hypothetical protein
MLKARCIRFSNASIGLDYSQEKVSTGEQASATANATNAENAKVREER